MNGMPSPEPSLNIDALIARIKAEAARLEDVEGPATQPSPLSALSLPKLAEEPGARSRYQLGELLCFEDTEEFLNNAYRTLLGREPDAEGSRTYGGYLNQGGCRSYVLYTLVHSVEGRALGVRVDGMRFRAVFRITPWKRLLVPLLKRSERAYWKKNPQFLPVTDLRRLRRQLDDVNAVLQRWAGDLLSRLSTVEAESRRIQQATARILSLEGATDELRGGAEWLQRQIDDLRSNGEEVRARGAETAQALDLEVARRQRLVKDIDFIRSDLIYHREQARDLLAEILKLKDTIPASATATRRSGSSVDASQTESTAMALRASRQEPADAYYVAFEEEFRGAQEEIRATQEGYLSDVRAACAGGESDAVLDLGCGRGEWLALLQEQGLTARGIDTNGIMVRQCRERGLHAEQGDALRLLSGLADGALGAVTAFHLIEHLPFNVLHELIVQCHRALRPGGVLILETPNPENLLVGSHTFYHDPTHRNPMTPTATRFLVRYCGFEDPEIRRLHPYPEAAKVPGSDPLTERVNGHLCGPQDFAVIARKPAAPE
jgi:O-antigen chain-terminating methyltransferase